VALTSSRLQGESDNPMQNAPIFIHLAAKGPLRGLTLLGSSDIQQTAALTTRRPQGESGLKSFCDEAVTELAAYRKRLRDVDMFDDHAYRELLAKVVETKQALLDKLAGRDDPELVESSSKVDVQEPQRRANISGGDGTGPGGSGSEVAVQEPQRRARATAASPNLKSQQTEFVIDPNAFMALSPEGRDGLAETVAAKRKLRTVKYGKELEFDLAEGWETTTTLRWNSLPAVRGAPDCAVLLLRCFDRLVNLDLRLLGAREYTHTTSFNAIEA
jgi:hypothetical protein